MMASAMFRPLPPPTPPSSSLRRPASDELLQTKKASSWTLASWQLADSPSRPKSLTPLLDTIGRGRRLTLSQRSDATDPVGGAIPSPRKAPSPPPGFGLGLQLGGGGRGMPLSDMASALGLPGGVRRACQGAENGCICQRAHAVVLCHVCGWYSRCRLMKPCREHPNTRFLLDITVCPRCRAPSYQMDEYDIGDEYLPPCPLPMPEPANGPAPLSARSTSPDSTEGRRASGAMSPVKTAARSRMRPPLQSDSYGMQRKLRDRFCSQCLPRNIPYQPYGTRRVEDEDPRLSVSTELCPTPTQFGAGTPQMLTGHDLELTWSKPQYGQRLFIRRTASGLPVALFYPEGLPRYAGASFGSYGYGDGQQRGPGGFDRDFNFGDTNVRRRRN